jgi:hypothetical protein
MGVDWTREHDSVDPEDAELLERQLLETCGHNNEATCRYPVVPSSPRHICADLKVVEDTRSILNTPASETASASFDLLSPYSNSKGEERGDEDGEHDDEGERRRISWTISLCKLVDSAEDNFTEEEPFDGVVISPSPNLTSDNDGLLGAEQTDLSSRISLERNYSSPGPSSIRFNMSSPSPPEGPSGENIQLASPPASTRVLRRTDKLLGPSKYEGGCARLYSTKRKRARPRSTDKDVSVVNLSAEEMRRRMIRSTYSHWVPLIADYITFSPGSNNGNKKKRKPGENREYKTYYPYEVPATEKSVMTKEKQEKVKENTKKFFEKFEPMKAMSPDESFVDSIFEMAKEPGRTMADVWERLRQEMDRTTKYTLVFKFLTFSVFIVNLSTKDPAVCLDEHRRCLLLTDSSTKPFITASLLRT